MAGLPHDSCSEGLAHDFEQRSVGTDKNYGEVSVLAAAAVVAAGCAI